MARPNGLRQFSPKLRYERLDPIHNEQVLRAVAEAKHQTATKTSIEEAASPRGYTHLCDCRARDGYIASAEQPVEAARPEEDAMVRDD